MMQGRGADEERFEENVDLMQSLIELRGRNIASSADSTRSYDELHAEGHLQQRDSFYKWLLSLLHPQAGQALLDISCGRGRLLSFAARDGLHVAGLDLSSRAIGIATQRVPSACLAVANAEALPYPDNRFDYITNIGSVEHYFHPDRALREMARVLRRDGLALVLLPNTFGLLGNLLHAWRKGDVFDDGQPLQRYGTRVQWCRLLELNGLRVVRTLKFERARPRTWADLGWYARQPQRLVRVLLTPLIPCNLASFLVFQCQKNL
jgi:SAM-dependent methyltransferase